MAAISELGCTSKRPAGTFGDTSTGQGSEYDNIHVVPPPVRLLDDLGARTNLSLSTISLMNAGPANATLP